MVRCKVLNLNTKVRFLLPLFLILIMCSGCIWNLKMAIDAEKVIYSHLYKEVK